MIKKPVLILVLVIIVSISMFGCSSSGNFSYTVTYEAQDGVLEDKAMDSISNTIKSRFEAFGYNVKSITAVGERTLEVKVAGGKGLDTIASTVGKQNDFKFLGPDNEVIITDKDIKDAAAKEDSASKQPLIFIKLTDEGKEKFASATEKYIGKQIEIYWDDELITSPIIQAAITNGEMVLTGADNSDEAKALVYMVKSGKTLPFTLKVIKVESSQ